MPTLNPPSASSCLQMFYGKTLRHPPGPSTYYVDCSSIGAATKKLNKGKSKRQ